MPLRQDHRDSSSQLALSPSQPCSAKPPPFTFRLGSPPLLLSSYFSFKARTLLFVAQPGLGLSGAAQHPISSPLLCPSPKVLECVLLPLLAVTLLGAQHTCKCLWGV